jgi:hypothetical protein
LQGCSGCVGDERKQESVGRVVDGGLVKDGDVVVEKVSGLTLLLGHKGYCEVVSKGIDYNDNSFVERLLMPTSIRLLI